MSSLVSPEIITSPNKFEAKLRNQYGDGFMQGYYQAREYRPQAVAKEDQSKIPCFDLTGNILEGATSFKLVEWQGENGRPEWRYVISALEPKPRGKEKYACLKVFNYDSQKKGWVQEVTEVDPRGPLTIYEKTKAAVKDSLAAAFQERFGLDFWQLYSQADQIPVNQITDWPMGEELKKFLPAKDFRLRCFDYLRVDPNANLFPGKEVCLEAIGRHFREAYLGAKLIRRSLVKSENQPPLYEQLAGVIKNRQHEIHFDQDPAFRFVEWVDQAGRSQFAYVLETFALREGIKRPLLLVCQSHTNEKGEPDLLTSYHPYHNEASPVKPERPETEPYWVVEKEKGSHRMVQVLRPSQSFKGGFEIVFLGATSSQPAKCLVFNEIYPEVTYLYTPNISRDARIGKGTMWSSAFPVCYLSGMDLTEEKSFWGQEREGKIDPSIVVPHELAHNQDYAEIMARGEKEYQRYDVFFKELVHFGFLTFLANEVLLSVPKVLLGNPLFLIPTVALLLTNTKSQFPFLEKENIADRGARVLIQTARDQGVDLLGGMPDTSLPLITRTILARVLDQSYKLATTPRFPSQKEIEKALQKINQELRIKFGDEEVENRGKTDPGQVRD